MTDPRVKVNCLSIDARHLGQQITRSGNKNTGN